MTATASAGEKLVYAPVFEALAKGLNERVTPAFVDEVTRLGVNLRKLLPGYPYELFEATVIAAARLYPDRERAEAIAEVGRVLTVATIDASPVGKHLMPLLRVMGTARALRRVYSRSTGENYNRVSFGAETPKTIEMSMTDVGNIPEMTRGSILGIGEAIGVKLRATITAFAAPRATYLIAWD